MANEQEQTFISDLSNALELKDSDVMMGENATTTFKFTLSKMIGYVKEKLKKNVQVDLSSESSANMTESGTTLTPGVTGVLPVKHGGTGRSSLTNNAVLTGNSTGIVNMITPAKGAFYANSSDDAPQFGTLPISGGGTGQSLTSAPSIITKLDSTTGDSPFKASPRPGVIGILDEEHGGTGCETLQAARKAMGLGDTTGALPIANGGTGTSLSSTPKLKVNLGSTGSNYTNIFAGGNLDIGVKGTLGETNGGTGHTSLAATREAMGLGNSTGVLGVEYGGTGSSIPLEARNNLGLTSEFFRGLFYQFAEPFYCTSSGDSVKITNTTQDPVHGSIYRVKFKNDWVGAQKVQYGSNSYNIYTFTKDSDFIGSGTYYLRPCGKLISDSNGYVKGGDIVTFMYMDGVTQGPYFMCPKNDDPTKFALDPSPDEGFYILHIERKPFDPSKLGDQVNFTLSGTTLTITTKT